MVHEDVLELANLIQYAKGICEHQAEWSCLCHSNIVGILGLLACCSGESCAL